MPDKAAMPASDPNIDSTLNEQRKFECPEHFRQNAHIKSLEEYDRIYRESVEQPEKFWGRIASELHWFKKWDKVLDWNHPWAKWFTGGEIQSFLQLPRPPRADSAQEQSRHHLGERTRRSPHHYLSAIASRSTEIRQRPEVARS